MYKLLIIFSLIVLSSTNAFSQIVFEQEYSTISDTEVFEMVLQNTGKEYIWARWRYDKIKQTYTELVLYRLNHSVYKKINLENIVDVKYLFLARLTLQTSFPITSHLVNDDDKLEIVLHGYNKSDENQFLIVIDENGKELQRIVIAKGNVIFNLLDLGEPYGCRLTIQTLYHINTDPANVLKVYKLKGQMPEQPQFGVKPNTNQQNLLGSFFPNPASNITKIYYELPQDETEGVFNFYSIEGKLVKTLAVDKGFKTLEISIADLAAGQYVGQLICKGKIVGAKKLIVIH